MSSEVLEGWNPTTLGAVAYITRGVSWRDENETSPTTAEALPVLGIRNVQRSLKLDETVWLAGLSQKAVASSTVRLGDILMVGSNGNPARIGNAVRIDVPGVYLYASLLFGIRPDETRVDSEFLFHLIRSSDVQQAISDTVQGSTGLANLKITVLRDIPLLLPPIDEQRRIAEVLRSIDATIQAASEVAAASLGSLTRVRDELICLPAHETVPLVELTDDGLFTDGDWVESKDQDPNGEVRLIQLADIGDGSFIDKSRRFLTMGKARQLRCTFLQEGDLLVARMPEPLGRCCLLPPQSQPCVTVVDVCVIRAGPRTSNRYLAHAIATSEFRTAIVACASGSTRTRVSRGNLGQLRVPLPLPGIQQDIIDALDQMALVSEQEQQAVEQMLVLKHEIMSDLLTGRVRVPE